VVGGRSGVVTHAAKTQAKTEYDVGYAAGYAQALEAAKGGDSVGKSALKAVLWRAYSTLSTVAIVSVVLGGKVDLADIFTVGGFEVAFKLVSYFAFERVWLYLSTKGEKEPSG